MPSFFMKSSNGGSYHAVDYEILPIKFNGLELRSFRKKGLRKKYIKILRLCVVV